MILSHLDTKCTYRILGAAVFTFGVISSSGQGCSTVFWGASFWDKFLKQSIFYYTTRPEQFCLVLVKVIKTEALD